MIPAIDMFSGIGTWTAAASKTGRIEVKAALNHNEHAVAASERMHPGVAHFQQDALEFNFSALRPIVGGGFVLGSPSCRDFSSAGQPAKRGTGGNGTVDLAALNTMRTQQRNTSWAVVNAAEALDPECVIIENVTQFVDKWKLFPVWQLAMESMGYHVRVHRLNALDFGGATDRERVFVTCRRGSALELIQSLPGATPRTIESCLDADDFKGNRWRPIESTKGATYKKLRSKMAQSGLVRGVLNNVGDGVRMRPLDDVFPTITRKTGSQLMVIDGTQDRVRIVNPLELTRAMGWQDHEVSLPKNRELAGELIGNAIPRELSDNICNQAVSA